VRLLGRYQGRNGQIDIVECSWDGTRVYFEEGVRQSQATPNGESVFTYVKLPVMFLRNFFEVGRVLCFSHPLPSARSILPRHRITTLRPSG
jgi:hypothetical protein